MQDVTGPDGGRVPETVLAAVRRAVAGELAGLVPDPRPLSVGPQRVVLALGRPGERPRLLLRVARRSAALDPERTAAVLELAGRAGVPVPAVAAAGSVTDTESWGYLLQEYVPGRTWEECRPALHPSEVEVVHRRLGAAVAALHTVRPTAFGELDVLGRPSPPHDLLPALRRRVELRVADPRRRAWALRVLEAYRPLLAQPSAGPPTLTHDDLHHRNVVLRESDGRPVLIDWDKAWAGPAEVDLARMAFWDGMTGPGFADAYGKRVGPDGAQRCRLYQWLWCLEFDDGSERHRTDTARATERLTLAASVERPPLH